jgi:peptidoglycan pentaglycine glycine transferase (the first glycine)
MMTETLCENPGTATEVRPIVLGAGEWDAFVAGQPNGHLLQASAWGTLKSSAGWETERVMLESAAGPCAGALVLYRRLPLGQCLAYIPRGPIGPWWRPEIIDTLLATIHERARRRGAFMLKIEPGEREDSPAVAALLDIGFRVSTQTVQPRSTIWIDLRRSTEDILQQMKPKWRYNIRLSARKGVQVRRGTADDLTTFSRLIQDTSRRDGFAIHSERYYELVYQLFSALGACELLLATYEGQILAGLMVFAFAGKAYYLYGASSTLERSRMPNHALQWAAMQWAQERGCSVYDLWGIPDEVGQAPHIYQDTLTERTDGLWSVYRFKQGFGGEVVRHAGAFDYVYHPIRYRLYRLALRVRRAAGELG